MSIVELVSNKIFQECRRACYHALATHGYNAPTLYLERQDDNHYMSYWGQGSKRMEVYYDLSTGLIFVYELEFVS